MLSTTTAEISLASWTRLFGSRSAAIWSAARRRRSNSCTRLEAIGLEFARPDPATPAEIINQALAGVAGCDEPEAIAEAHKSFADSEAAGDWFEAGDDVDAVLEGDRFRRRRRAGAARRLFAGPSRVLGKPVRAVCSGAEGSERRNLEEPRTGRTRHLAQRPVDRHSADAANRGQERARLISCSS